MTDATLRVTQQAVEQFAETYLLACGAEIRKDKQEWSISLSADADTELDIDGATLLLVSDPAEVTDDALVLSPESDFFHQMLDEATHQWATGSFALTADTVDTEPPAWVGSNLEILEQSFTPYYDRTALCVLFHIGIETVSEYQQEALHAAAVDLTDLEPRPSLAETCLRLIGQDTQPPSATTTHVEPALIKQGLDIARDCVEQTSSEPIQSVQEKASRAADVEISEYETYVRQRLGELENELDSLTERISEVNEQIDDATTQQKRMDALRRRKELQTKQLSITAERDDMRNRRERGFPEKRAEIRNRHTLSVRFKPVTLTLITYERGDLELTITDGHNIYEDSYGYALGAGTVDTVTCARCETVLSSSNCAVIDGMELVGNCCLR
ncbi:hypothetical protein ACLI4Q_10930 [Natrialbaceae archaeon A-CW1-1]